MPASLRPRHLAFDKEGPLRATVTLGRDEADAIVLAMDIRRVEIAFVGASAVRDVLPTGMELQDVRLHAVGARPIVLTRLQAVDGWVDEDGDVNCVLEASDEASRAGLWLTIEHVCAGEPGVSPAATIVPTGVASIPARGQYTEEARRERLEFIRQETGAPLASLESSTLIPQRLTGNIENHLGAVEVPVGIAGPLWFRGQQARGIIYAPLATTEGTLVASATRGARAITRSGGVTTRVLCQQMMRVPLFVLSRIQGAVLFNHWIRDHTEDIRAQVRRVSTHARLVSVEPIMLGSQVHVRFLYETGDAAGQNMTTTCTWHACQWLMGQMKYFDEIVFENFVIEANMSSDKKVTFQSFIGGRGTRVIAEAYLERQVLESVLKITPEQLAKTNHGFMTGSFQVGMVGYNINIANIIAAIYTATGQDIASVHESSLGQLHLERAGDGMQASMLLPSLIVGTVGGGTHLRRQRDLLEMMGCNAPGRVARFAEAIAGYCLALDLSTLSAIASGQFANAHERLGRNRPIDWFQLKELNLALFEPGLRRAQNDPKLEIEEVEPLTDVPMGSSIITELTARKVQKLVGHLPFRLHYLSGNDMPGHIDVIAKVKPLDAEVELMTAAMASMCGPRVGQAYDRFRSRTGFSGCHHRELALYQQTDPRFVAHAPKLYEAFRDDAREAYVLILERLENMTLMDTADDVSGWERIHIETALSGIAQVHAIWYGRAQALRNKPWIGLVHNAASMAEMSELWDALGVHAREEFPEWISPSVLVAYRELVQNIPDWWGRMERHPKTLIHNDFNPRNICLRPCEDAPAGLRLCAYDWELATVHLPQHDLAELLAFVLRPDVEIDEVDHYVEFHRRALSEALQSSPAESKIDPNLERDHWRAGYDLCLRDLTVNRLALYVMAHTFRHYGFMERVVHTLRRLLALETGFE